MGGTHHGGIQNRDKNNFKETESVKDFVLPSFLRPPNLRPCAVFQDPGGHRSGRSPFLNIVKLNVTENPEDRGEYGIAAVPHNPLHKEVKLVDSHVGVMQPQA